jgi:hypothetical protein
MLEKIENIDWESLGYPQAPELVRQLASNDTRKQVEASERLETEVVLGGYNWQSFDLGAGISVALRNDAPLLLVPYLFELLKADSIDNKPNIMYLLERMLFYNQMIDEGEIYKQRAEKIRTAIWEGRLIYIDLLSSQDLTTREHALTILMEFTESSRIVEVYDLVVRRFEPALPPPEIPEANG